MGMCTEGYAFIGRVQGGMQECARTAVSSRRSLKVPAPHKWSDRPGHPHHPDGNPEGNVIFLWTG